MSKGWSLWLWGSPRASVVAWGVLWNGFGSLLIKRPWTVRAHMFMHSLPVHMLCHRTLGWFLFWAPLGAPFGLLLLGFPLSLWSPCWWLLGSFSGFWVLLLGSGGLVVLGTRASRPVFCVRFGLHAGLPHVGASVCHPIFV